MKKPKKTILQLETLIKKVAAKTMLLPKDIVISIWPVADSWKVVCHSPHPIVRIPINSPGYSDPISPRIPR
jgi:hypothetical protein